MKKLFTLLLILGLSVVISCVFVQAKTIPISTSIISNVHSLKDQAPSLDVTTVTTRVAKSMADLASDCSVPICCGIACVILSVIGMVLTWKQGNAKSHWTTKKSVNRDKDNFKPGRVEFIPPFSSDNGIAGGINPTHLNGESGDE